MNVVLRFPPKLHRAVPVAVLTFCSCKTRFTMIGSPDVVVTEQEHCSLCRGVPHKPGKENCRSYSNKPFPKTKNSLAVDVKPVLLREKVPEMPDWDFELKAKLLVVEGNIGVGKTTLTEKLAEKLLYRIFLEPTTENPYLGKQHKFFNFNTVLRS